jgi:hypothetical protein
MSKKARSRTSSNSLQELEAGLDKIETGIASNALIGVCCAGIAPFIVQ